MFSIDQNCHSLWDVIPKLQALAAAGHTPRHFIEDIDTAFTAIGTEADTGGLRLARERFYPEGGADWGAALFYSEFLGRLPADLRSWEPLTGMKTAVLAKRLGRSRDELYDELSPSDNWQLIGPSYVGDRGHHRVIGDLTVAETAEFLRQLLAEARVDMLWAFPDPPCQQRITEWFQREQVRLDLLLTDHAAGRLVELYRHWMAQYLGDAADLDLTSRLFAVGADPARTALLEVFLADYQTAAGLYNEAIAETDTGLRALKTGDGELPFFAVLDHQGHRVRTGTYLRDGALHVGGRVFGLGGGKRLDVDALRAAGIRCLAGKAALLVIQARIGPGGRPLALPYRGSLYMPAAHRLAEKLASAGLLSGALQPIVRVRFHLLDRLGELETPIRLPDHLARAFGRKTIPARELADNYRDVAQEARGRLERFRTDAGREQWQRERCGQELRTIDQLDRRRRELAEADAKSPEIRDVWKRIKAARTRILWATVRQIADDRQTGEIDYWDSRGALMPWSIALGGAAFYGRLIADAEIYTEPPDPEPSP